MEKKDASTGAGAGASEESREKKHDAGAIAAAGAGADAPAGAGRRVAPTQLTLKYLAPEAMAAAVIGRGGAVVAAMRASCSAKIMLTEHGEVYPQTDCRVLTAQANSEESLNEVSKQILAKAAELVSNGDVSEVGANSEPRIRMLVPRAAVGGVIGKGGADIKRLRESTGAKISISEPAGKGPAGEQLVTVTGPPQAAEAVFVEVNRQIQMLRGDAWYPAWASTTGAVKGGGYGDGLQRTPAASIESVLPGLLPGLRGEAASSSSGTDIMMRVVSQMPPEVLAESRGFAMSCVVPSDIVGGIIGRGGSGIQEVQNFTSTKIGLREIEGDPHSRTLNIIGSLANTCAAYMLMMKRYIDAEEQMMAGSASRLQ